MIIVTDSSPAHLTAGDRFLLQSNRPMIFKRSPRGHWTPGRGLDVQRCYLRWLDGKLGTFKFARSK